MPIFDSPYRTAPVAFRLGDLFAPRQPRQFQQDDIELTPEDEQSLLSSAVDVGLSGLAKAGNILDLPGSSVRDILSGENPFDQWAPWNWTSNKQRTSPEDMLQRLGVLSPQFRKQHPVWSFLGGTAAAIATDPLTFTGLPGVARLKQAGDVAKRAGLLNKLDNVLPAGMGRAEGMFTRTLGDIVPDMEKIAAVRAEASAAEKAGRAAGGTLDDMFTATRLRDEAKQMYRDYRAAKGAAKSAGTTLDALRGETLGYRNMLPESWQLPTAQRIDQASDWLAHTVPVRAMGAAFQAAKGGQFGYYGQKVAQAASRLRPEATVEANRRTAMFADEMRTVVEGFQKHFKQTSALDLEDAEVFDLVQELTRFSQEAGGRGMNMANPTPQYQQGLDIVREAAKRRINTAREQASRTDLIGGIGQLPQGPTWDRLEGLATKIRDTNKAIQQKTRMMGGDIGEIDIHSARYISAKSAQQAKFDAIRGGRTLGVSGPSQKMRSEEIAKIYTPVVNEMLVDQRVSPFDAVKLTRGKYDALLGPQAVRDHYGAFLDDTYKAADDLKKIADDTSLTQAAKDTLTAERKAKALIDHSKDLAKWVHDHKPKPLFDNPNLLDEMNYLSHQLKVNKSIEAIHELFRRTAINADGEHMIDAQKTNVGGRWANKTPDVMTYVRKGETAHERIDEFGYVKLEQAFKDAGFKDARAEQALKYFAEKNGMSIDDVKELAVPAALANEASGVLEAVTNTKFQSLIGDAIDAMNRVFKIGVTAHPANWVRNRYSGIVVNMTNSGDVRGAADIGKYVKWDRYAKQHRSDPELIREVLIHNVVDPSFGSEGVEFGVRGGSSMDVFSGLPPAGSSKMQGKFPVGSVVYSKDRSNFGKVVDSDANRLLVTWTNPETKVTQTKWLPKDNFTPGAEAEKWWNVKQSFKSAQQAEKGTVSGAIEVLTGQPPGYAGSIPGIDEIDSAAKKLQTLWQTGVNTSSKANAAVEWQNRVAMYLYLTKEKGYSKMAAAEKVSKLQLDYRHGLSGFEKTVMRRAFPFYSFSRLMADNIVDTLLQRPGGVQAQMIKASGRLGGRDAMTPEYVSEGLSVPLGTTPEGDVRYFSATGMPYEDLFSFFGGRSLTRTMGMEAAARATPYIKGPAEWVTGRSFFQQGPSGGRNIEDLDPVIGRTIANASQYIRALAGDKDALSQRPLPAKTPATLEQLASNSPLSRYLTTTRTLLDPRKNPLEKAVNLLSGARVTTISPQARLAMVQERLGVLGKEQFGGRDMSIFYVPEKELERLRLTDPAKYQQAMKFKALQAVVNRERRELRENAKSGKPVNQADYNWAFR